MPASGASDPRGNRLLQALPEGDYERLAPHLRPASFEQNDVVCGADEVMRSVYFPLSGALDIVATLESGRHLSVLTVGKEGFVGHVVVLGTRRMRGHVSCQIPARCVTMPATTFLEQVPHGSRLWTLLLRHVHVLLNDAIQTAACNQLHPVEQQLIRCLLLEHDRLGIEDFPLTHELMAEVLGIRRATVTETIATLARAGLIRTARRRIVITDHAGLVARACECYRVMTEEYERVVLHT